MNTPRDKKPMSGVHDGPYTGQQAALATMHGKHEVLAPVLLAGLGLVLTVPSGLDTDLLGTFTGEIERPGNMLEVAVAKARLGMSASHLHIGIASEGSYGPHPAIPFFPIGYELLVFVDDGRGITIKEHMLAASTNFSHVTVDACDGMENFLMRVGFPDHGLIVRPNGQGSENIHIVKGIQGKDELDKAIAECVAASSDGRARVETDMRAHMNPTRMAAIAQAAERLVRRIETQCPACATPGYGRVDAKPGLPCSACGTPTEMMAYEILGCVGCKQTHRSSRSDGLENADPGQCPFCNP